MMIELFAKAGHKIYDERGAHVATTRVDIFTGQNGLWPSNFEFHDGSKPQVGESLPRAIELFKRNGPYV